MRYATEEITVLFAPLNVVGADVRIVMVALDSLEKIELKTDKCVEVPDLLGAYAFNTSNIVPGVIKDKNTPIGYCIFDKNNEKNKTYGKITLGGVLNNKTQLDLTSIKEILTQLTASVDILIAEQV